MTKVWSTVYGVALLSVATALTGCDDKAAPTAPSIPKASAKALARKGGNPDLLVNASELNADGGTLKSTAATPQSPKDNAETGDLTPVLTLANASADFLTQAQFDASGIQYFFEIKIIREDGTDAIVDANRTPQTTGTTSYRVNVELEETTNYKWRARPMIGAEAGPWSDYALFRTPTLIQLGIPTPLAPPNNGEAPDLTPELVVTNAEVVGDVSDVMYEFSLTDDAPVGGELQNASLFSAPRSTGTTTGERFQDSIAPGEQFWWQVRARSDSAGIVTEWSVIFTFHTKDVNEGPRASDPPPGELLPVPNHEALVIQLAAQHPAELADSCQDDGGSWHFLNAVVDRLRQTDTRWGYNCKRGNCNDPSHDVVAYHAGAGPTVEGVHDTRTVDIILGHCGPGPAPAWQLQDFGDDAAWTSRGRF